MIGEPNMATLHKETSSPVKSPKLPPAHCPAESPPTDRLVPMTLPSTSLSSPSPTSPSPVGQTDVSFNFEGVGTKNPLPSCSDDNDVNQNDRQNDREEQKQTDDDIVSDVEGGGELCHCFIDLQFRTTFIQVVVDSLVINC